MATVDSTLPLSFATDLIKSSGKTAIIFDDLSNHVESLSDNEIISGVIVFKPLTSAQRDTVMTFHTTNRNLPFDYVHPVDGVTYTLHFTGDAPFPQLFGSFQNPFYSITYQVIGTG